MEKTTGRIEFEFHSDNYPDIDLTFYCDEDLTLGELASFFRKFAFAMGYAEESINEYVKEDETF